MNATTSSLTKATRHYYPTVYISGIDVRNEYKDGEKTKLTYELVSVCFDGVISQVRIGATCEAFSVGDVGEAEFDFKPIDNGYRLFKRDGKEEYVPYQLFIPTHITMFKKR